MEDSVQPTSEDLQPDGEVQQVQDFKVTQKDIEGIGKNFKYEKFRHTTTEKLPLEGKRSYGIQVLTPSDETFMIPVIDARDDNEARLTVEAMNKDSNRVRGSKFFKPSASLIGRSYNESWKKEKSYKDTYNPKK